MEQLLQPQASLLSLHCPASIERMAQRYVGLLIARAPLVEDTASAAGDPADAVAPPRPAPDYQEVDIDSLQQSQARSAGVEHVGLQVLEQLGFGARWAASSPGLRWA